MVSRLFNPRGFISCIEIITIVLSTHMVFCVYFYGIDIFCNDVLRHDIGAGEVGQIWDVYGLGLTTWFFGTFVYLHSRSC